MNTTPPPMPTERPKPGHYWQYDPTGWRQVRPLNWFWLLRHTAPAAERGA